MTISSYYHIIKPYYRPEWYTAETIPLKIPCTLAQKCELHLPVHAVRIATGTKQWTIDPRSAVKNYPTPCPSPCSPIVGGQL